MEKVFVFENAVVTVVSPNLSEEENARRMKILKKATSDLLKEVIRNKKKGEALETKSN